MKRSFYLYAGFLVILAAYTARASLVEARFEGTVDFVGDRLDGLAVQAGDAFLALVTVDLSTPPDSPQATSSARYQAVRQVSLNAGAFEVEFSSPFVRNEASIVVDGRATFIDVDARIDAPPIIDSEGNRFIVARLRSDVRPVEEPPFELLPGLERFENTSSTQPRFELDFGRDGSFQFAGAVIGEIDSFSLRVLTPLTGDYNANGQVEQGDLDIVLQNWGTGVFTGDESALAGGGPFDGLVDQNELDGVLQNWGSAAALDFHGVNVPEPASMFVLVALTLLSRRLNCH